MARKEINDRKHGEPEVAGPVEPCWLCLRPLGEDIEWHHPVPKSRGGRVRVGVHPICHGTIHATFTNGELARLGSTGEALRANAEIGRFVEWIADKPPDFYAPTAKRR